MSSMTGANSIDRPTILLLGFGYTLSRVASKLGKERVVVTSTTQSKVSRLVDEGWHAEHFQMDEPEKIGAILERYSSLNVLVDGTPPKVLEGSTGDIHAPVFFRRFVDLIADRISQIVYLSTTGVFGVEDGSWVDEDTEPSPKYPPQWARLVTEQLYCGAKQNTTILRLPAIYGPGRGIGHAIKNNRYTLIADRQRWTNRIQVEDLSSSIYEIIKRPPQQNILCVTDDEPALQSDVVKFYCDEFDLPNPSSVLWDVVKDSLHHTQRTNQRVSNLALKVYLNEPLVYPTYREGAKTEWEPQSSGSV